MINPQSQQQVVEVGTAAASYSAFLILGARPDALALGLFAAICTTIWFEQINSRLKAVFAILLSALLAGYGAPILAEWVSGSLSTVSNTDALHLLCAVVIGGLSPALVPLIVRKAKSKGREL